VETPLLQASFAVDLVEAHRRVPPLVRADLGAVLKTALDEGLGGFRLRPWRVVTVDGTTAVVAGYAASPGLPEPAPWLTPLGVVPVRSRRVLAGLVCPMENSTAAGGERPVWAARPDLGQAEAVAAWAQERAAALGVPLEGVGVTMKGRRRTVRKARGAWVEFGRLPVAELRLTLAGGADPLPLLREGLGRQRAYGFGCLVPVG
jgi:hypothetical protein